MNYRIKYKYYHAAKGKKVMVKTANPNETIQTLKQKIVTFYEYLLRQNDLDQAEKVKQLAKKLEDRKYLIAFCGHFSAGKSTMINRVIGEDLLPSSPIPTSANLVKVKSGEEYAKVLFKNEKPRLYLAPYDYDLVKNYCKDGDQIEEIEISRSGSRLAENSIIMDTPGIDSADDAHRVATESAIHLADMIFYVMDYNHVQAELNFLFTKELYEAGKEVYLVINQIDKHKDVELSFSDFKKSVIDSFLSWGVKPARIFFTSLKEKDHMNNQFLDLQAFIAEKLTSKEQFLLPSVYHSLKKIALDHLNEVRKSEEDKLTSAFDILEKLSTQERTAVTEKYQKTSANLEILKNGIEEKEKEFDLEITKIMKSAYLMPFQTRVLAESYLESCQPEFKVGFLFSKQKTLEVRKTRLDRFYEDLLVKTKSQLEWHIREFLLRSLKEMKLDDGELGALAQGYSINVPIDLLSNTVKSGARLSGEYVLYYTENVADEIKNLAGDQLKEFKMALSTAIRKQYNVLKVKYEQEFTELDRYIKAITELEKHQQTMIIKKKEINGILTQSESFHLDYYGLFKHAEEEYEVIKSSLQPCSVTCEINKSAVQVKEKSISTTKLEDFEAAEEQFISTIERLQLASDLINDLPGFQNLSKDLLEKAERLEHKGFTVALFGAFSAGKSSFANALMGEKVLPVSPNPTTAAINKIKPVTDENPHGTVLVKFKEAASMLDNLNRSLKFFDLSADNFSEAVNKISQIVLTQSQEGVIEKTHYAFLQAFHQGYDRLVNLLGTVKKTGLNEFHEFVAKEEKSCYVEWIELYYDCELTRKGVTLVDTPGADSINVRHTGVAFDYIKNADAILFVTYYNHAFSKADREFLIQLGRVKDSFQMDKMFFIINAIDLAENEEEKYSVVDYVRDQLVKYGIRNPHLFSLSSLCALNEKLSRNHDDASGMSAFEQAFYQFISYDLSKMAISAADKELDRVRVLITKLIETSKEEKALREQKRLEMEEQKRMVQVIFAKQSPDALQNRLAQEAEELIYYIKQRVFLRFGDFFKEAFNPSTLREDGRNLKKVLQGTLEEFLNSIGFDLAQEMRATIVRMERFVEKLFVDYQTALKRNLQSVNNDLSFSVFEAGKWEEIDFPSAFKDLNSQLFTKAMSYFKNPKSFFEKNEKRLMSEELYKNLNGPADEYLKQEGDRLKRHYENEVSRKLKHLLIHMEEQADDFYLSLLSAFDGEVSTELLSEIQEKLPPPKGEIL